MVILCGKTSIKTGFFPPFFHSHSLHPSLCLPVFMYIRTYMYSHVYAYVCVCVCVFMYIHTYIHMHVCIHMRVCAIQKSARA